jgi:Glycoside-hydrolase family GH114
VLTRVVRARRYAALRAPTASFGPGTHAIVVRLLNPRRTARCRRALRVDRLVFTPVPAPAPAPAPGPLPASIWRPAPGTSWQWQLTGPLDLTVDAALYDVDLFDVSAAAVADLHRDGRHVVCYLDAGTYEPGRPDAGDYPESVRGAAVEGWPGERWLDIRRLDVLAPLIERRLDLCRDKGFDGVEPDNVDAYANASGFPLSAADQLAFNRFLASAAHARGLSVGLKNDLDQAATLEPAFDWALDEQCYQYDECALLQPFARAGKAVLIAEYELAPSAFCARARAAGYSAIRKRLELGPWRQACQ